MGILPSTASRAVSSYFSVPCDALLMNSHLVFLPQKIAEDTAADLSRFGEMVISQKVLDLVSDAERNVPYVRGPYQFISFGFEDHF